MTQAAQAKPRGRQLGCRAQARPADAQDVYSGLKSSFSEVPSAVRSGFKFGAAESGKCGGTTAIGPLILNPTSTQNPNLQFTKLSRA